MGIVQDHVPDRESFISCEEGEESAMGIGQGRTLEISEDEDKE